MRFFLIATAGVAALQLPRVAQPAVRRAGSTSMALKLELDPEEASKLLEEGPAASQGPFGKGGALEWVAKGLDDIATVTLAGLHAFDDKEVQDSSKNLQVLWSRAVLAHNGELDDDIALQLLPKSTRGVVSAGLFDGVKSFLEWVAARTDFLNEGCDAFLSSPSCVNGDCQIVIFGAGFDTRSLRYQRDNLRFFEVDLPETIAAKACVQERYKREVDPNARLPTRVGWDLNDCEQSSLLDHLASEHGFRRDVPTMFVSEAVMFYVNPIAIGNLYDEIFRFGQTTEAMYCFTDSMRPFVQGPFADETREFFGKQNVTLLSHTSRWSGAVQFAHAVARTPAVLDPAGAHGGAPGSLLEHVGARVEPPVNSYAPERSGKNTATTEPSFNDHWYAIAYSSELAEEGAPYSSRLFGEPLLLRRERGGLKCETDDGEYACADHQGMIWVWRGEPTGADHTLLPTHPTPEATHTVETILDYGCDWTYIVENNLDTPHLYWLHDGSIPPIESLGCNRNNIGGIGLRFFTDDIGIGHIGKTSKKVTKVVRFDSPNVVRHGGVSGFSEEFNIVPLGPHRTRVLLRQRFPKGPILSTLLNLPGTREILQYLVRNWNYQIALEDYSVMQGQAHNIDDFGAPNWKATSNGDDLIVKFWQWYRKANRADGRGDARNAEYFTRWDGSTVDLTRAAASRPLPVEQPTHREGASVVAAAVVGEEEAASSLSMRSHYVENAPIAEYPPINHQHYAKQQGPFNALEKVMQTFPQVGIASAIGASAGVITASLSPVGAVDQAIEQAIEVVNAIP